MMVLYGSLTSPFTRKVRIAAAMLGVEPCIEFEPVDTMNAQDRIRDHNPLGKVPALVLDDGPVLYDSSVIVEYLDHRAGGALLPKGCDDRFRVKTEEVLADGIMEATVLIVYEGRFREEARHEQKWLDHQADKIERALAAFERLTPEGPRTVADVALACALGFLDLRLEGRWRDAHPRLAGWLANFGEEVPAFEATRYQRSA